MRVFLEDEPRNLYFKQLKEKSKLSWFGISARLKVNSRQLRDYKAGRYSIPQSMCLKIEKDFKISLPQTAILKKDFWNNRNSARLGGLRRFYLYGDIGTPESRKKGGLNSIKSQKLKNTSFKFLKHIYRPQKSEELAELVGIMIGDGGITNLQVRVSLNLYDDLNYSKYVSQLFEKLFKLKPSIYCNYSHSTIEVVVSSKELVGFLNSLGLPIGNKIKQKIDMPAWIKEDSSFRKWCIRGLFDTDGCIYLDKHNISGKKYCSLNIAITSASAPLLLSIVDILQKERFSPTRSGISVRLRSTKQVITFFGTIGSSNYKNIKKFEVFI